MITTTTTGAEEGTRICTACKTEKSLTRFNRNRTDSQGRQWKCRECFRAHRTTKRWNKPASMPAAKPEHLDFLRTYQHDTLIGMYRSGVPIDTIAKDRGVSAGSLAAYFVERYGENWRVQP